jgi:hypothetical protein
MAGSMEHAKPANMLSLPPPRQCASFLHSDDCHYCEDQFVHYTLPDGRRVHLYCTEAMSTAVRQMGWRMGNGGTGMGVRVVIAHKVCYWGAALCPESARHP